MMPQKPLIINLAPTGMIPTKDMSVHVPTSPDEIVSDVLSCAALGVGMVHLHARDEDGNPAYQRSYYEKIIPRIRSVYPDLVVGVTTSGRTFNQFEQRAEVLSLTGDAKPDMASLTLSSVNFNKQASINSPEMIMDLASAMKRRDIKPEMEIFDLGMVNFAHYLIKKGLVTPPYYFNIILGNIAAAQARLLHLGIIMSDLPQPCYWAVSGIGDSQLKMNVVGAAMGDGVRIGLEDTLWFDSERTELATNVMLVERMIAISQALGRPSASGSEIREMLALPSWSP